jgi:hypothetical protein
MPNYPADPQEAAAIIAGQLNEDSPIALAQIARIVERLGAEVAYALLAETLRTEAEGGVLRHNSTERRTAGGVFFYLVRGRISADDHRFIWPDKSLPHFLIARSGRASQGKPSRAPIKWQDGLQTLTELLAKQGIAMTAKLTLVGRPGKVIDKGDVILTTMTSQKLPTLPKGLPEPPDDPTVYLLFIARKQWQKVAAALEEDAEDKLIVEGYPVLDKARGVIAVLAQNATTAGLQRAKRPTA